MLSSLTMHFAGFPWDYALILLVMAVLVPWRGTIRVRQLLARPSLRGSDRIRMYVSTAIFQWIAAAITLWRVHAREAPGIGLAHRLGIAIPRPIEALVVGVGLSLVLAATQIASLRGLARLPPESRGELYQIATKFMPQTAVEMIPFVVLVCTVSLCEEFLYRGFAILAFSRLFGGSMVAAVFASSALFAIGHLYQGRRGVTTTFVLGCVLAGIRVWTGSLAPCVLVHFVVDLMAGIVGPRAATREASPTEQAAAE